MLILRRTPTFCVKWEILSVDFIIELPKSIEFNIVITVVNSISNRTHFIPTHTMVTVEGATRLSLYHV